jgi:hypothetical protein
MNFLRKIKYRWLLVASTAFLGTVTLCAQAPAWWTNRYVVATNAAPRDFAPITQGQLKWLATQAAAEFDEKLQDAGGAGTGITALVMSFSTNNYNYRPVNSGQLKNTTATFYERLFELGLTNCYPPGAGCPYPWSNATNAARDFAAVNIGQAKYLFSFDLTAAIYSTLNDGIPDWWTKLYGFSVTNAASTMGSNGLTWIENYVKGLNPNQSLGILTIPNAWAVYTNSTNLTVFADIRSASNAVTVKAAEFFIDNTNGVVFGSGTAMSALDGVFDSTNEMALATFTPTFAAGTRHFAYIHAQGINNNWCPFVKVIINPNINDILGKIQANYSAIRDLQFDSSDSMLINGVVQSISTYHVKQKGAYKYRIENVDNGNVEIFNHNFDITLDAGQQIINYQVASGADDFVATVAAGPSAAPDNKQMEEFCWDISTFRQAYAVTWNGNVLQGVNGWYYLGATANDGTETIQVGFDYTRGVPVSRTFSPPNLTPYVSQSGNVTEINPGVWLPLSQTDTMTLLDGTVLQCQRILTAVQANTGLDDSNFSVPPPP